MTFYKELQLNQAGSKNLLKKSETRKEKLYHMWVYPVSYTHLVPSAGLSARPAHAAGGTLAQRAFRQLHSCKTRRRCWRKSMPDTAERGNRIMAIFHFTIKIVGRSKGKSVISASSYLNGCLLYTSLRKNGCNLCCSLFFLNHRDKCHQRKADRKRLSLIHI